MDDKAPMAKDVADEVVALVVTTSSATSLTDDGVAAPNASRDRWRREG